LTTDATAKCCRDRMRQEIDVPEENDELAPQYPFCECQGFRCARKFDGTARLRRGLIDNLNPSTEQLDAIKRRSCATNENVAVRDNKYEGRIQLCTARRHMSAILTSSRSQKY
jgi:hypothetical protein